MAPIVSRIPVPSARRKQETSNTKVLANNLSKLNRNSIGIAKRSGIRQPLQLIKQHPNQPVLISESKGQLIPSKPVEPQGLMRPPSTAVVAQKKKLPEAKAKAVRFNDQPSVSSATASAKDPFEFESDPAALQSILNHKGVASLSHTTRQSGINARAGSSIYNIGNDPRLSIYSKSALKKPIENGENHFLEMCVKLGTREESVRSTGESSRTPIRPHRPTSIYEVRGKTPGSAAKTVQQQISQVKPSAAKKEEPKLSMDTLQLSNYTVRSMDVCSSSSSATVAQPNYQSGFTRGKTRAVLPSPLVTLREESFVSSDADGSLRLSTNSIVSASEKTSETGSVGGTNPTNICAQLAAMTVSSTPVIESQYSQLSPQVLKLRKESLLKRLSILDKHLEKHNPETVESTSSTAAAQENVVGRLSFDDSGVEDNENGGKPVTIRVEPTVPLLSVENREDLGWRDKIATPKPKRAHHNHDAANGDTKEVELVNMDLSICDEDLIDFEPPMKTPMVLRSVSKIQRGAKVANSASKNSSPLGGLRALRPNCIIEVSPSPSATVKKVVASSVRDFLDVTQDANPRAKSPLFDSPITSSLLSSRRSSVQSQSFSQDCNNETLFMPADSILGGDETFLRDELSVADVTLTPTQQDINNLSPIGKPSKRVIGSKDSTVGILVDIGDDNICDHEVCRYTCSHPVGTISLSPFERIENPIAKNFIFGDDFVSENSGLMTDSFTDDLISAVSTCH